MKGGTRKRKRRETSQRENETEKGRKEKEREGRGRYGWSGCTVQSDLFAVNLLNHYTLLLYTHTHGYVDDINLCSLYYY